MTSERILECVPNFSEGRDLVKIQLIAGDIEKVAGVKLLHVDPGFDTNRTVMTFAGTPEAVVEAAYQAVKKASEIIDMRHHKGVHPRFGATDVLPLVPVSGITMDETVKLAHQLGQRIGTELGIHVYFYEYAASDARRKNLASCRAGEYEGLAAKVKHPEWLPDYGPATLNEKSGAIAIGARNYLIAYNINLNTADVTIAKSIAAELRESGHWITETDALGKAVKKHQPGKLKNVKAIGWYIPDYQKAQVSTNLTDIHATPLHLVFEEAKLLAEKYHVKVTGSELVGLIPLEILEATAIYCNPHPESTTDEKLECAVKWLGLDELTPFDFRKRVLEYCMMGG